MADQYQPGLVDMAESRDVTTITGCTTDGAMGLRLVFPGGGSTTSGITKPVEGWFIFMNGVPSTTTLPNVKCPAFAINYATGILYATLGNPGDTPTSWTNAS